MARRTSRRDAADSLQTKEDIAAYFDVALEDGDPNLIKAALGDIAPGLTESRSGNMARASGALRVRVAPAPFAHCAIGPYLPALHMLMS